MTILDWAARAICVGEDPEIFFSDDPEAAVRREAICGNCPVRRDCLTYAGSEPSTIGYWGGVDVQPGFGKRGGSTRGLEAHRDRLAARIQERIDSGHKTCARCKVQRPFGQFQRQATAADGHRSACSDCLGRTPQPWRNDGPIEKKCSACAGLKPIGEFFGYPQCGPCRAPRVLEVAA